MWDNHQLLRGLANLMLAATALMLLYAGGFWLTHAPVFPVKKIQIRGDMKRVTPEQLKFIAEHELSGTFFTLDIDKTRAAFGKLPWVRDAQVRRRWPDALDISVEEHVALARWGENGLVNTRGERFDAASDQDLPVFYGPAGREGHERNAGRAAPGSQRRRASSRRRCGCPAAAPGKWGWTTRCSWSWDATT